MSKTMTSERSELRRVAVDGLERLLKQIEVLRLDVGRVTAMVEEAWGSERPSMDMCQQDLACLASAIRRQMRELGALP